VVKNFEIEKKRRKRINKEERKSNQKCLEN